MSGEVRVYPAGGAAAGSGNQPKMSFLLNKLVDMDKSCEDCDALQFRYSALSGFVEELDREYLHMAKWMEKKRGSSVDVDELCFVRANCLDGVVRPVAAPF